MEIKNRQNMADEIWLCYFNDVLYDKGIITEAKRNKMKHLIHDRYNNISSKNKKATSNQIPLPSLTAKLEGNF